MKEEVIPCPQCGGEGREIIGENFVSRDMASDAGYPEMEGMHHSYEYGECEACDGTGLINKPLNK